MKFILLIILLLGLAGLAFRFYILRQKDIIPKPLTAKLSNEEFFNREFLNQISLKYPELNFKLEGGKITSSKGITIEAKVVNHRKFSQGESFQLNFFTSHKFFQNSIEERLSGIGENDTAALQYGIESFLSGQFPVVLDGIGSKHSPEMDFEIIGKAGKIHWHPLIGDIQQQGELSKRQDSTIYEKTYSLIKPLLVAKLKESSQDFHWFRYYISKMQNGEIIGDCYYDNAPYEEGLEVLKKFALTWETTDFAGQKQFIMLRQCHN